MAVKDKFQEYFESYPALYRLLARGYFMKDQFVYGLKNPGSIGKKVVKIDPVDIIDHFKGDKKNYFFGYYDKSPWSSSERYLLFLSTPRIERHPTVKDEAEIGYIDLKHNKKHEVGKTRAWNWQQGCMLKWLDNEEDEPIFIHNDFRSGRFVSVIRHIKKGEMKVVPFPFYDVDWKNRRALSLNFEKLHHLRPGYGYHAGKERTKFRNEEVDGIYALDLTNQGVELLVSLSDLAEGLDEKVKHHWVNHIEFNPSGSRVVFFHRYLSKGIRRTRMMTMNPDGSDIYCLVDGSSSHFTWKNDDEILAYAGHPSDESNHYYLFKDRSDKIETVGKGVLCEDGHPSFSPDGDWLLTDTYPDKGGRKKLILYDMDKDESHIIGKFYTPIKYRLDPLKSDLHPRWNRRGDKICIDSVHEGRRKMYIIDLKDFLS